MDINDYLIVQDGKDWPSLLEGWIPPLPSGFTLWMVNRLGDIIAIFEDQSIHFLDIGSGQLTRIAEDQEDFIVRVDQDAHANEWLAISLVDDCVAAGKILKQDQCYGYKIPPLLGGEYSSENLEPTDLSVHYKFLSDIWRQTKDMPEGTKVRVKFID